MEDLLHVKWDLYVIKCKKLKNQMIRTLIKERYSLGGIFEGILSCVYPFVSPTVKLTVVPSVLGRVADNQTKGLDTCGLNDEASISIERRDDEQCSVSSKKVLA